MLMASYTTNLKPVAIALAVIGLVIASLKWLPAPFIWILVGLSLLSFWIFRRSAGSARVIWFNVCASFLVLLVLETALEGWDLWQQRDKARYSQSELYVSRQHPALGYLPVPGSTRRVWKTFDGEKVYDVTYTFNDDGFRISPPVTRPTDRSALFFGCSMAFGEGVEDDETMPYQVGVRLGGEYAVHNFGVHGYGPQQMLAIIETGMVRAVAAARPRVAVYEALYPDHVHRVAGVRPWLRTSPRYVIGDDGRAVHTGRFVDDGYSQLAFFVRRMLAKSALGRRAVGFDRPVGPDEDAVFVAVVVRSAELLREQYPGVAFHVLMWGAPPPAVTDALERADIRLHFADPILEAAGVPGNAVYIERDGHPSAAAHAALAEYVAEEIIRGGGMGAHR